MGLFEDIPLRENGDKTDSSWWNTITMKLREAFPNIVNIVSVPVDILNNQSAYHDITGIVFLNTQATTWVMRYEIYRKTSLAERLETGVMTVSWKPILGDFVINRRSDSDDDALNMVGYSLWVDLATGKLQYKSDNMSGTGYVGKFSCSIVNIFKAV